MAPLLTVFNHLVLPPKVPGEADTDSASIANAIGQRLVHACDTLIAIAGRSEDAWASIQHCLHACLRVNQGRLEKASLKLEFHNLQPGETLILHIVEQNAALLVRRDVGSDGMDTVIFESFEASASSEAVIAGENALEWTFPGRAAQIPFSVFENESFRENLAMLLEQASMESIERFRARSVKAETSIGETRDTTNPALITQMLLPLLEAVGSSIDVPRLRKKVRDEVNIQNAGLPWRRSPFWLILRVATQLHLYGRFGSEIGRAYYKFLICTVLAELLRNAAGDLSPELTLLLRAKLCRRLAKIEMDKAQVSTTIAIYEQLLTSLTPMFQRIIKDATVQVQMAWDRYKQAIKRPIPRLPHRASEDALHLSLPNSASYIHHVLSLRAMQQPKPAPLLVLPSGDVAVGKFRKFADHHYAIAELERMSRLEKESVSGAVGNHPDDCAKMANSIHHLFDVVGNAYEGNPQQMSLFILTLFELWIQMDEYAVKACGLLAHYRPVFEPDLLDVLQLSTLSDMERLHSIQTYLHDRSKGCRFDSIFNEPDEDCFAAQYVHRSSAMRRVYQRIQAASNDSRQNKESEWHELCKEYDNLSQRISDGTCVCSTNADGTRSVSGCKKCWHWRCRKRLQITIHEDFLPRDKDQAAAVVFELCIPPFLAAYRSATWKIVSCLGHPGRRASQAPVVLLKDHSTIEHYARSSMNGITLASTTKSFALTHFKALRMRVDLSKCLFPLGLRLSYYDTVSETWLKDLNQPLTFHHICGVHVPRGLHASVIPIQQHPLSDADALSSYEIMANQGKCPSDMSFREFMTHQRLRSGHNRRWLVLLVELGASNLNFSSEDTMLVFTQLAMQAGPNQNQPNVLRDAHSIFRDRSFCEQLSKQISLRIRNISSNWREGYCMDILITLTLRLCSLACLGIRQSARQLLEFARTATSSWIDQLRNEVRNATGADAARRASIYALWAALLCRKTFTLAAESESVLDPGDLSLFVQASLALQENLTVDPELLPQSLKNMLVQDLKMAYHIRSLVLRSIRSAPEALGSAIDGTWSDPGSSIKRVFSPWQLLTFPSETWVASIVTTTADNTSFDQSVHYNLIEGQLLVNGKPLGRLPASITDAENVKELFGDRHLLTYPSSLNGMSHMLTTPIRGHWIHFGHRSGLVVIRAVTREGLLEHLPRRIFVSSHGPPDLPSSLVQECTHWLNINTKCIEIRRKPAIWKTRASDWILDFANRRAKRKKVTLVDPNSALCRSIAGIFSHFEDPQRITVFQPAKGSLSAEMRVLELSFFVNRSGLLVCRELRAEIDPNQDAGTFYGLESKIVLRDENNHRRRSIITAIGALTWKRNGMHVSVRAATTNQYGKFQIDDVLGRISSPPEPLLIYTKALFHAFTSFPIPDPLTGRSGCHEAIHLLRSGSSQPWSPLSAGSISKLKQLQELAPTREYYPKDKRRLQTVNWDEDLTVNTQHDSYEHFVEAILTKSNRLQAFDPASKNDIDVESKSLSHLSRRGEIRRFLYEHWNLDWGSPPAAKKTKVYYPRDRNVDIPQATKVYRVVNLILRWPYSIPPTKTLADLLQSWEFIGGFKDTSEIIPSSLRFVNESNLSERWGQCVQFCQNSQNPYDLVFLLALMAFGPKPEMDMIVILASFGSIERLKSLPTPLSSSYTALEENASPNVDDLLNSISTAYVDFIPTSRKVKQNHKAREKHLMLCEAEGNRLVSFIVQQWPFVEISLQGFHSAVIDIEKASEAIAPEVERLRRNRELSEYAIKVQEILDDHRGAKDVSSPKYWNAQEPYSSTHHRGPVIPSLLAGLQVQGFDVPIVNTPDFGMQPIDTDGLRQTGSYFESFMDRASAVANHVFQQVSNPGPGAEIHELDQILSSYTSSPDLLRQEYGKDLKRSLAALESVTRQANQQRVPPALNEVQAQIPEAQATLDNHVSCIREVLSIGDDRFAWLRLANLWPSLTLVTLLELLRSNVDQGPGEALRECLVACGLLVTTLQKLRRIEDAIVKGGSARLQDELRNEGHANWSASEFPDWLLLEIDSNILIRPEQIEVAHAIISPASSRNSVLQMNMGQGKTSCIVPMAMAILANKEKLARLIVPKALLLQTAQTIQSRLGGLVGREIRHVAYFRHTPTTPVMRRLYAELHMEVLNCCGVILTTPEHVLSYRLSGLQLLADSKLEEARDLIEVQSWLDENCRDVLDESDFTLAVKTQLIYPSGSQMTVDGGSYRWRVAQGVLSLVEDHLIQLQRYFPRGVEVVKRPKGFPMMYFPQKEAEDALQRWIINDICSGKTPFLRLTNPDDQSIDKIGMQRLLLEDRLDQRLFSDMTRIFADSEQASKSILILRGLLMNRILLLCLKKRWNVQYGLHPHRDPVAVPFEAKGVPSELSEFGHPDVAIMFTCLAFYYSGLTVTQFREGLAHILNSDDPAPLYDTWVSGSETMPEALRYWNVINIDDQGQLEELWQHLRFSRNVLDHYMNNFVFPQHAKQFTLKIQASGWDLPLFSNSRSERAMNCARTTGFSGTNDNKMMLPLTIKQDDLDSLRQTNAEVLGYLLQPRNRIYNLAAMQGRRLTEEGLLQRISNFGIRVFIDAGAYILEMDNQSLVKAWLDIDVQAKGAVYFGMDNRAWLQYRGSKQSVPLIATPFAENLDECLVYLDEAHTRGIDLKLPQFARGALTLALGQTKDHTVQAAMRLRQLGSTQSVVFFAPPEVHQSILDCNGGQKITVNSSHVVRWLLEQTCSANEQLHNLYLAQGTDFCRRINARHENPEFLTDQPQRKAFLDVIQPPERQSLEQLYGSIKSSKASFLTNSSSKEMKRFMEELDKQRQSAKDSGNAIIHSSALEEVEQERLVEFQVEEVRVVQKPKHYKAHRFPGIHPAISRFAKSGVLIGDQGYVQAFEAISQTYIGEEHIVHPTSSLFFVSSEFLKTIYSGKPPKDDFFRPVEWILWAPSTQTGLILIPEEAEALIPHLGADSAVHLIPYAAPVTKYMLHFNRLSYYALPSLPAGYEIPDWFLIELGIFSGRLYIDFQEYQNLMDYLQNASKPGALDVFTNNPISFLLDWLSLRCKGQDISQTPMGYICQGRSLKEDHPFFLARHANTNIAIPSVMGRRGNNDENETDDDDSDIEDHGNLDTEIGNLETSFANL